MEGRENERRGKEVKEREEIGFESRGVMNKVAWQKRKRMISMKNQWETSIEQQTKLLINRNNTLTCGKSGSIVYVSEDEEEEEASSSC